MNSVTLLQPSTSSPAKAARYFVKGVPKPRALLRGGKDLGDMEVDDEETPPLAHPAAEQPRKKASLWMNVFERLRCDVEAEPFKVTTAERRYGTRGRFVGMSPKFAYITEGMWFRSPATEDGSLGCHIWPAKPGDPSSRQARWLEQGEKIGPMIGKPC